MAQYALRPATFGVPEPVIYIPGVGGRWNVVTRWAVDGCTRPVSAAVRKQPIDPLSIAERGAELAAALREQDGQNTILVGHSLGALIAFEAAIRLPGCVKALVALAQYPPHAMTRYSQRDLEELSVLTELEAAVPADLAQAPDFLEVMREVWREDYRAAEEYEANDRVSVPIVSIGAANDPKSSDLGILGEWDRYCDDKVNATVVPGRHNFVEALSGREFSSLLERYCP